MSTHQTFVDALKEHKAKKAAEEAAKLHQSLRAYYAKPLDAKELRARNVLDGCRLVRECAAALLQKPPK